MPSQPARPGRHLDSERGFLEVAGRDPDRPLRDQLLGFRDLVSADMDWADTRKRIFRRNASIVRIAALVLAAASASTGCATKSTTTSSEHPRPS